MVTKYTNVPQSNNGKIKNQLNYVMLIISVMSQKKQSFASKPKDDIHRISCCKTFCKHFHHFLVILCVYYAAKTEHDITAARTLANSE